MGAGTWRIWCSSGCCGVEGGAAAERKQRPEPCSPRRSCRVTGRLARSLRALLRSSRCRDGDAILLVEAQRRSICCRRFHGLPPRSPLRVRGVPDELPGHRLDPFFVIASRSRDRALSASFGGPAQAAHAIAKDPREDAQTSSGAVLTRSLRRSAPSRAGPKETPSLASNSPFRVEEMATCSPKPSQRSWAIRCEIRPHPSWCRVYLMNAPSRRGESRPERSPRTAQRVRSFRMIADSAR